MVRHYKPVGGKPRTKAYTADDLQRAITHVKSGESINTVATTLKIPRRTLRCYVTGERGCKSLTGGRPTALLPEEELCIAQHMAVLGDYGYAFDDMKLRLFVKSFLEKAGRSVSQFKDNLPGVEWVSGFVKRHKDILSKRMCQNISRKRAAISVESVTKFYDNLERSGLNNLPPENIINYDETNFCDDPKGTLLLYRKGIKHPERVMNVSKTSVSVMFAGSASGVLLDPYVVYRAEHLMNTWVQGGPIHARYNRTKSGWFDSHCFGQWFAKIVVPYFAKLDNNSPRAMIGDNLASHLSAETIDLCEQHNIKFILLPPNSTHLLQPLDVCVFGPMKRVWKKVIAEWKLGMGKHFTTMPKQWFPYLLFELLSKFPNVGEILVTSFAATGIYPLNKKKVIEKLEHSDIPASATHMVSPLVIQNLQSLREAASTKPGATIRGKRLKVSPGKCISSHDLSTAGGSAPPKKKTRVPVRERSRSDSDDSSISGISAISNSDPEADEEIPEEDNSTFESGDYILVKFASKKHVYHYVGKLMEKDGVDFEFEYLRRRYNSDQGSKLYAFANPETPDIYTNNIDDLVKRLPKPSLVKNLTFFPAKCFLDLTVR